MNIESQMTSVNSTLPIENRGRCQQFCQQNEFETV
jgi:hypothetical protein